MASMAYTVESEEGFERTYTEDDLVEIRRGDLRALLDLATGSMDFGSGFWDNEQVEVARKVALVLDVDPMLVTPSNFSWTYGCRARGSHQWRRLEKPWTYRAGPSIKWLCDVCRHTSTDEAEPTDVNQRPEGQS